MMFEFKHSSYYEFAESYQSNGDSSTPNLRGAGPSSSSGPRLRGSVNTSASEPSGSQTSSAVSASASQDHQNGGGTTELLRSVVEQHQTTQFLDQSGGERLSFATRSDYYSDEIQHNVDLANYLSRPVMIYDSIWNESDTVGTGTTITPWQLYMNTTSIKNKLQNYLYFRGKLHLKIVINASPFYYGALLMNYIPMNGLNAPSIVGDTINSDFLPKSQMPHIWVYPQANQGGEIVCPFFYFRPWLNIGASTDVTNMGALTWTVINQLQSANGATGTGVYFSIYAWLEDVEFLGTTSLAVLQSEWATGPISKPASALSKALSSLKNIPVIGSYATATSMVSEGVGRIASNLGYSNPPVIENTCAYKPQPFPQLAATEISTPIERLAIDPKNEISIDPAIFGMSDQDELDLNYICGRESYLTSFNWVTSSAVNAILFRSVVTPGLTSSDYVTPVAYNFTPMSYIQQMFGYWRGDIIFRFKIVCTQYHKGRLLIMFDPTTTSLNPITTTTDSSTVFTQVLDIGQTTDVEFRVPYMQAFPWLRNGGTGTISNRWSNTGGNISNLNFDEYNGSLAVRVLNPLTAPIATSTIQIQVFVKGADNLEFNNIRDMPLFTPYTIQTQDEVDYENAEQYSIAQKSSPMKPNRYLIAMGEKITSARQLLRRDNFYDVIGIPAASSTTANIQRVQTSHGRFPRLYGYDTHGWNTAAGTVVPGSNFPFNFTSWGMFSHLSLLYIGARGSVNWTYQIDNGTNVIPDIRVFRNWGQTHTVAASLTQTTATYSSTIDIPARQSNVLYLAGTGGTSVTNQITQAGVSVNVPFYSNSLFEIMNPAQRTLGLTTDSSSLDTITCDVYIKPAVNTMSAVNLTIAKYFSIGPDFTFCFFLCCPTLYLLTTVPSAV